MVNVNGLITFNVPDNSYNIGLFDSGTFAPFLTGAQMISYVSNPSSYIINLSGIPITTGVSVLALAYKNNWVCGRLLISGLYSGVIYNLV